jgi:hypothetical protein
LLMPSGEGESSETYLLEIRKGRPKDPPLSPEHNLQL